MIRRGRSAGFTLFELLVSIGILGVISTMGVRAFFGLTDVWEDARGTAELDSMAQAAFETMREDFSRLVPGTLSGRFVMGEHRSVEDTRFFQQFLGDDRLVLPVYAEETSGDSVAARVEYRVDRDSTGNALVRVESPLDGEEGTVIDVMKRGDVLRLRFEFLDPDTGLWSESWSRPAMPAAVRASMTLARREVVPIPGPPRLQVSRKAVFAIHGG